MFPFLPNKICALFAPKGKCNIPVAKSHMNHKTNNIMTETVRKFYNKSIDHSNLIKRYPAVKRENFVLIDTKSDVVSMR